MKLDQGAAQDFKIGLFIIITVLSSLICINYMQKPETKAEGALIKIRFGYVAGLAAGAPVRLAGVKVGEVSSVEVTKLEGRTGVDVVLRVGRPEVIEEGSDFRISAKGLLGSKFIEVFPAEEQNQPIDRSRIHKGSDPVSFEKVLATGDRVVYKMEKTVDAVNTLIADDDFRDNIQKNTKNLSDLIIELRTTSQLLNDVLSKITSGQGTIGRLITEDQIYKDLAEFVADIKRNPWKLLKKR